jgi:hypothetical protein
MQSTTLLDVALSAMMGALNLSHSKGQLLLSVCHPSSDLAATQGGRVNVSCASDEIIHPVSGPPNTGGTGMPTMAKHASMTFLKGQIGDLPYARKGVLVYLVL